MADFPCVPNRLYKGTHAFLPEVPVQAAYLRAFIIKSRKFAAGSLEPVGAYGYLFAARGENFRAVMKGIKTVSSARPLYTGFNASRPHGTHVAERLRDYQLLRGEPVFQLKRTRKEKIVFQVYVLVQVLLKGFERLEERAVADADIRRRDVTLAQLTHLASRAAAQ